MMIYYIAKVEDNICYLSTGNKEHSTTINIINISDLKEFSKSNIVIGYNSLTGSVQVKEKEDILKYIMSKVKLVPSNHEMFKITEDKEEYYLEIHSCSKASMSGDDIEITVSDMDSVLRYNLKGVFKGLRFRWSEILYSMVDMLPRYDDSMKKRLTINLDIQGSYKAIVGHGNRNIHNPKWLDIVKFNILNKDMFKECEYIYSLFNFNNLSIERIRMTNCKFDFENYEFNSNLITEYLLPPHIDGNINYNDTFYKGKHRCLYTYHYVPYFADEVPTRPPIDYLINIPERLNGNENLCSILSFKEIRYSDLEKLKGRTYLKDKIINVESLIFDKPLNENTDVSFLNMMNTIIDADRIEYTEDFDIDLDYEYIKAIANLVTALQDNVAHYDMPFAINSVETIEKEGIEYIERTYGFKDMEIYTFLNHPKDVQDRVVDSYKETVAESLKVISDLYKHNSIFSMLLAKLSFILRNSEDNADYLVLLDTDDTKTKFLEFMLWGEGRIKILKRV